MQMSAPEAVDFDSEPQHVKNLYGLDHDRTRDFGKKCLLARRLVEQGVRFIQIYSGGNHNDANWDAHGDLEKNHNYYTGNTEADRGLAGGSSAARDARRDIDHGVVSLVASQRLSMPGHGS